MFLNHDNPEQLKRNCEGINSLLLSFQTTLPMQADMLNAVHVAIGHALVLCGQVLNGRPTPDDFVEQTAGNLRRAQTEIKNAGVFLRDIAGVMRDLRGAAFRESDED